MNDETAIAVYAGRLETLVEPVDISAIMGTVALPAIDDHPRRRTLVAAAAAVLVAAVVVAAALLAGNGPEAGVDTVAPAPLRVATSTIPEGRVTVTITAFHDDETVPDPLTIWAWIDVEDDALEDRWDVLYQKVDLVASEALPDESDGIHRSRVTLVMPAQAGELIATAGQSGASLAVSTSLEQPQPAEWDEIWSFPGYPSFPGNRDGESTVVLETDPNGPAESAQDSFPSPETWVRVHAPTLTGDVFVTQSFLSNNQYGDVMEAVDENAQVVGVFVTGIGFVEMSVFRADFDWREAVTEARAADPANRDEILRVIEERGGLQPTQPAPPVPDPWPPL